MRQQKNIYKYSGSGAPNVSGAPGLCPPSSIGCDATGDIRIKLLSTLLLSLQAANRLPLACLKVRPLKTDGSMGDMSPSLCLGRRFSCETILLATLLCDVNKC